jgi:hypothetical protein
LRAVKRVFVVGTVVVVVAHHAEEEFRGEWGEMRSERYVCSVVGGLFEAAESQGWNGLCLNIPQLSVLIGFKSISALLLLHIILYHSAWFWV